MSSLAGGLSRNLISSELPESDGSSRVQDCISRCCGMSQSTIAGCPVGAAPPSTAHEEKSVRKQLAVTKPGAGNYFLGDGPSVGLTGKPGNPQKRSGHPYLTPNISHLRHRHLGWDCWWSEAAGSLRLAAGPRTGALHSCPAQLRRGSLRTARFLVFLLSSFFAKWVWLK